MRSIVILLITAWVFADWSGAAARGATAAQVQSAIDRGTQYIYSQLKGDNWELVSSRDHTLDYGPFVRGAQWGGITALSTYALLAAGESPQDPRIARAVEFLRTADLIGTYAVALRSQVWLNIPKNDLIREAIAKDAKLLLLSCRSTGKNAGEFTYTSQGPLAPDHSNSQYGVLGLWACSDALEGIPVGFWQTEDQSWRNEQGADGSWGYNQRPGEIDPKGTPVKGTATMTAAALATLFINQQFIDRGRGLECSGNAVDASVAAGLSWLGKNLTLVADGGWSYYALYGVERVGVASGYKYIGDIDWYERGADALIKSQSPKDGSFPGIGDVNVGSAMSLINTSLGILFLSRGRAPVMMNKLNYGVAGQEANWNQRPRDVASLARWVGKETENTLNWQIITTKAPLSEWFDAPILYIAGNQSLRFTPAEIDKLRAYVEAGGMILGNADCGRQPFVDSFEKLGAALFKKYAFKPISPSDIIMRGEQFNASKWRRKPTLLGMDNGARELMLLLPNADPARAWQMQETAGKEELFQMGGNIYLYAVDKNEMTVKGNSYFVEPNPTVKALRTIEVTRLRYQGNWDPEPGGWRRLNAVMHNTDRIDITVKDLDPALDSLVGKRIAHLTGTDRFKLSTAAVAGIQAFIKQGGTLIVDSAGGKTAFSESADQNLQAIFGNNAEQLKDPLPDESLLYSTGPKLASVKYRTFARSILGNLKSPRLRGITVGNRLVCVYSPEDLSVGLVGEPVDGIYGYSPVTATELMRKILLFASSVQPPTNIASRPTTLTASH